MNPRAAMAFVDVLFLVALILILIPHGDEKADPPLLGVVVVELTWTGRHDIDLWVRPAGGGASVGYMSRQNWGTSLLFDDLGHLELGTHREVIVVHAARNGHYIANVHLYRFRAEDGPAVATVTLWVRQGNHLVEHWSGVLPLEGRQERTAIRWDMRGDDIIPGSERFDLVSIRGQR